MALWFPPAFKNALESTCPCGLMVTRLCFTKGAVAGPGWEPGIWWRMISCFFCQKFQGSLQGRFSSWSGPSSQETTPVGLMFTAQQPHAATAGGQGGPWQAAWRGQRPACDHTRERGATEQRSRAPRLDGGLGGAPPTNKEKTEVLLNWSFYGYFISSLFTPLKQPY